MLDKLPTEVLEQVLGRLGTRSLLRAAATCTAARDVAARLPLSPVLTGANHHFAAAWLVSPGVRERVVRLTARRCMTGGCRFLEDLANLQALVVTFGYVRPIAIRSLPTALEHLDLHRLDSRWGGPFFVSCFDRLPRLRTLKLTFTREWDTVVVDGLSGLPLETLVVRQAPYVPVEEDLRVDSVHLHAVHGLRSLGAVHARELRVECDRGQVDVRAMLTPESARGLRELHLASPSVERVPVAPHLPSLERLSVRAALAVVHRPDLVALRSLAELRVETAHGPATEGEGDPLPARVDASWAVAGVPVPRAQLDELLRPPALTPRAA